MFRTELSRLAGAEQRRRLAAVDAMASSTAWRLLRSANGLPVEEATKAVADALIALLTTAP